MSVVADAHLQAASERLELINEFAERVRRLRNRAGLTRRQLAETCGVSPSVIVKTETAKREPRLSVILILAAGLGVSPGELLGDLPAPRELGWK